MKYKDVLETAGNTPVIRLSRLFPDNEVFIKDERRNPGGSIKDRIAIAMIEEAEKSLKLKPGGTIIEPTSGNTGIGLAMAGAVKGYRVILVMPETMSTERRRILKAYGAELILTPGEMGMEGAVLNAEKIADQIPGSWLPNQFENPANPKVHEEITSGEIISDFPDGVDFFVAAAGTGGHISGIGRALKKKFPGINIVCVEPSDSPVLSGGKPGQHLIQGIGPGFVPKNFQFSVQDRIIRVETSDAYKMVREIAGKEGLLAGISTGAVLAAVSLLIREIAQGKKILSFVYDNGERYLSVPDLFCNDNHD